VGLKSDFTILDVDDHIRLLKQLLQAEDIDEKRWPARVLAGLIDGWKNRGLTPEQVPAGERELCRRQGQEALHRLSGAAQGAQCRDFGDLLIECIRLVREQPEVLRQYQGRFRYILVDEYQDTNVAQYLWLRLLGQSSTSSQGGEVARKNICCGRRRRQSIYGWRGAEVDNICASSTTSPAQK